VPPMLRWGLALTLYFGAIVGFLRSASPGSFCGYGGPSPGLWWGDPPTPSQQEYYLHRRYYDSLFLAHYLGAGLFLTACGAILSVTRLAKTPALPPFVSGAATCAATLTAAASSDVGSLMGVWRAPLFLLHDSYSPYFMIVVLPKVFLPAAIGSGLIALGRTKRFP